MIARFMFFCKPGVTRQPLEKVYRLLRRSINGLLKAQRSLRKTATRLHGTLVRCTGIFQSKGHHQVLEQADRAWYSKCYLVHVFRGHEDLVVNGIAVHKTHHFVAGSCVDQCFCNRHRVFVPWCCSVEISKIDANTPSAIRLLYRYHARDPFCIPAWPDEPSI